MSVPRLNPSAVLALLERLASLTSAAAESVHEAREELAQLVDRGDAHTGAQLSTVVRMATADEHRAMLQTYALDHGITDADEMASCVSFIREHFTSDGPGYCGPVGFIHWGGGPDCITILVHRDGRWEAP